MDTLLEKKLQAKGAVLIEGPKWCGKTTTAEEIALAVGKSKKSIENAVYRIRKKLRETLG